VQDSGKNWKINDDYIKYVRGWCTSLSCDRYVLYYLLFDRLQIYFIQITANTFLHIAEAFGLEQIIPQSWNHIALLTPLAATFLSLLMALQSYNYSVTKKKSYNFSV